jgi:glycosyltransferase involved in cell wall biosynthesis
MKSKLPKTIPANLICFSHLRWDFVYQRPQHLLSRFSNNSAVWFFEEPIFDGSENNHLSIRSISSSLHIVIPHLQHGLAQDEVISIQTKLLKQFTDNLDLDETMFWYYTPMALQFSSSLKPKFTVFDCMDELSAFKFAPAELLQLEQKLMTMADVVFTGGHSLYEAKKHRHNNIHPFPSGIDKEHFGNARKKLAEPADQVDIKGPKMGFYGVIDERFDIELIREMAAARPDWQFILIGPVVKIDQDHLPRNRNIHYLGMKTYDELPAYLSNWDVAMIPFMLNESTEFISPTKTPEYLAAGVPVVSSRIKDVVKPYGTAGLVHICSGIDEFVAAIDSELHKSCSKEWLQKVDTFLEGVSWDITHQEMHDTICRTINEQKISIAS